MGELGAFTNGINKPKEAFGSGHPFVNLMDVFGVPEIESTDDCGLLVSTDSEKARYNLLRGDVLFVRSSVKPSGVGLTTVVSEDLPNTVFSGFLLRFRNRDGLDTQFKRYCFQAEYFRSALIANSTVSANTNINQGALKRLSLIYPSSLDEQRRVALALRDIDDLIAALDALIAKKRDIKQAVMQQLLMAETRLPGFAGEWATVELGTLCSMKSGIGITSKSISEDGPFPVFGANGTRGFASTKTHSGVFPLIGRVGALCGNIQIARGDFFASEHAIVAEPKGKTDPEWLALALSRLGLNRLSEASAQPVLTVGKLAVLRLYAPTDPLEQREISKIIFAMEAELNQLAIKRGKLCEVREGMMQQLLTGRIRLV